MLLPGGRGVGPERERETGPWSTAKSWRRKYKHYARTTGDTHTYRHLKEEVCLHSESSPITGIYGLVLLGTLV